MAELDVSAGGHKKGRGGRRGKKLSTRVDLTPMVDLGFLLITFFIFTTTMSRPTALHLKMPKDSTDSLKVKASNVITLLLGKKDKVFYYEGDSVSRIQESDYRGIRTVLMDKKLRTDTTYFQVILKPSKDCSYRNTVSILDEMLVDDIHHYAIVDMLPSEYTLLQRQPGQQ